MAADSSKNYDDVPYTSLPFAQTQPDRLATIAWLFGMTPAMPSRCRVLELGGASGGNMAPLAERYPNSEFVCVDYSARQVADGQKVVQGAGLRNIRLMHGNILELGPQLGMFDYIVCHGVYSWVPRGVQDKIMQLCRSLLNEQGVGLISYNTSPGWRLRGTVRDLMMYRAQFFESPADKLAQGKALLDFLSESVPEDKSAYGMLLKSEVDYIRALTPWYLLHEYLEDVNESLYFHEFMTRAKQHGLEYLGESDIATMLTMNLPPQVGDTLRKLSGDIIQTEQYMDFVRNRLFRQTLLCHGERQLKRNLTGERIHTLHVASNAQPPDGLLDPNTSDAVPFKLGGAVLTSADPIVKAAMLVMKDAWPCSLQFNDLLTASRSRLRTGATFVTETELNRERDQLSSMLLRGYTAQLVSMSVEGRTVRKDVPARPLATKLARVQAVMGDKVATLLHEVATLPDLERLVVQHLDGLKDHAALVELIAVEVLAGRLNLQNSGQPVTDPAQVRELLNGAVTELLKRLAGKNLLCPDGWLERSVTA